MYDDALFTPPSRICMYLVGGCFLVCLEGDFVCVAWRTVNARSLGLPETKESYMRRVD